MITFAVIRVGAGEAVGCRTCAPIPPPTYDDASDVLARVNAAVNDWSQGPGPNVAFRGPEPLLHPSMKSILDLTVQAGVERICLVTNGTELARSEVAEGVAAAGVTHIRLSILGPDAASHDGLSGSPGSFDAAMAGLAAFESSCQSIGAKHMTCGDVHVCKHNLELLPASVVHLATLGVHNVCLDITKMPPGARPWLEAAMDTGMVSDAWVCECGAGSERCATSELFGRPPVEFFEVTSA